MPHLDAGALASDPEGLDFLRSVVDLPDPAPARLLNHDLTSPKRIPAIVQEICTGSQPELPVGARIAEPV